VGRCRKEAANPSRPGLFVRFCSRIPRSGRRIAMTRVLHGRWLGSSAIAWLVIAVVQMFAPAPARAGCSHPWVRDAGVSAAPFNLSNFASGGHKLLPEPSSSEGSGHRGPCAGRACSQPSEMPPISTVLMSPQRDQWGGLPANPAHSSIASSRGFSPQDDRRRPYRFPTPIERPPRLFAAK
jgi:hypothetical protein